MLKKEEQQLHLEYEYPKKTSLKYPKDKLYFEKTVTIQPDFKLDKNESCNEQFEQIMSHFKEIKPGIDKIVSDYLFLKMYKYVARRDEYYNKDVFIIEKLINKLKGDYAITNRYIDMLKRKEYITSKDIDEMYNNVLFLNDFVKGLSKDITNFRKKHYKEFKMSSYFIVQDKSIQQIEELSKRIDDEVKKFKNITEASDYFIYNSGKEISDLINEILNINKKGVMLDYHYFIKDDAIICFTYPEWIDLMTKFKYVFSKIKGKVELTDKFKELYNIIETRFAIILISKEL